MPYPPLPHDAANSLTYPPTLCTNTFIKPLSYLRGPHLELTTCTARVQQHI
uniref:Uncharacterized protein n=1 Tax=Anguilla anguilla TaxID=7936 RepID=A0A0E9UUH1_ANGAN